MKLASFSFRGISLLPLDFRYFNPLTPMVAQVFEQMELDGVEPDMVTCCSLLKALERGGEWALAEQLFCQVPSAVQVWSLAQSWVGLPGRC